VAGEDSILSGMAGRYASALFDLATEAKAVDVVGADLARFDELIAGNEDLARLVRSPVFSADEQTKAVTALLERVGIGGLAGNFIRLVAQNRRLFAVRGMARAYKALVARARGETTADVVVAQPLADDHLSALRQSLASATGRQVVLNVRVDPSLIGGLTVQVGSRMIDASLKTKLQSIKIAMKEVG
jgi:F-type H+-transporting ATPase subunit delta